METINIDGEIFDAETGELVNLVEEVEVEVIDTDLPSIVCKGGTHIKTNTVQLERELIEYLKKYDVEVTEETEKECSKKATQLNKLAGELDKERKRVASEIKKPADELKQKVDRLINIIQEKRTALLNGVSVFKEKRFEYIKDLLEVELFNAYNTHGVEEEFRTCDVSSLIVEGSLAKVDLTNKAKEQVEAMAIKAKAIQSNVKIRLLELPIKCNSLQVPLERGDIEHIIKLDEVEYNNALSAIIEKRMEHELKMEEALKEKQRKEEEFKQKIEEKRQQEAVKELEERERETGVKKVYVTALFEVEVPLHVKVEDVENKYKKELSKFSTLKTVSVTPF